ncbi:MAG TPA: hypothetical protein VFI59_09630 [Actinomycetota bacterium]|nr:hypothetical protein [Actinomycetota bacterium]
MNDQEILDRAERAARSVVVPDGRFEELLRRRDRKRRNQRIAAGVVGITVFVAAIWIVTTGLPDQSQTEVVPGGAGTGSSETEPPSGVTGETTGTWPCWDSQDGPPPWVCFGPLEEGTYRSQRFDPALTFTVPAGWNNPWDTRGSFYLWTPGWSDGWEDPEDPDSPGLYADYPGVRLSRDARAVRSCSDAVVAGAGTSALELATWVSDHPGIATDGPSPVEIGGLAGYQLDVSIAETWHKRCSGRFVSVEPLDGAFLVEGIWSKYATSRLILLDLPDGGSVLIDIDGTQVDAAMPVVRSFEFGLS